MPMSKTFKKIEDALEKAYYGKKVPYKYQHRYGKRYGKKDIKVFALAVARSRGLRY